MTGAPGSPPSAYAAAHMLQEIDDLWTLTEVVNQSKARYWSVAREPTVCDTEDPYSSLYAMEGELLSSEHMPDTTTVQYDSGNQSSSASSLRRKGPDRLSSGYAQNRCSSQSRARPRSAPHGRQQVSVKAKKQAKGAPGSIYARDDNP